jgi:DNA-binding NarL/FixJ family response regulator
VLTQYDEVALILNFLKLGVSAFLSKSVSGEEIISAMRSVINGNRYFNSRFDDQIIEWLKRDIDQEIPSIQLSKRELQIAVLLSKGYTNHAIGDELGVTHRTIETYRYKLIKKVKVKNTVQLFAFIYRNGLLREDILNS